MAVSDVSICNRALQKLGSTTRLTSLDDDNSKARALKLAYEPVRRAELRKRVWRFAIARDSLPALAEEPDSDYDLQYELPNDYLRLLPGGDLQTTSSLSDYRDGVEGLYSVEGHQILTNIEAPLSIRYLRDVTDAASFDSCFVELLAAALALECCEEITESASKKQELRQDYMQCMRDAARANAFEKASEQPQDDTWVTARQQ